MNVICGRCETEYEFDDALVSERGTTVKCTNCGLQFRVQPAHAGRRLQPERWLIRQASGTELIFTSLAELQRAIAARQVRIEDSLSKDAQEFRPIREVAELRPFFNKASQAPSPAVPADTLRGLHQASAPQATDPLLGTLMSAKHNAPPGQAPAAPTHVAVERLSQRVIESPKKHSEPPHQPRRTPLGGLGPADNAVSVHVPPSSRVPYFPDDSDPADTTEVPSLLDGATTVSTAVPAAAEPVAVVAQPPLEAPIPPGVTAQSSAALERRKRRELTDDLASTQLSGGGGAPQESDSEPPPSSRVGKGALPTPIVAPPRRRGAGMRWVVGLVLLGGILLLISTAGKGYLSQFVSAESPSGAADERVQALLSAGEQHIVSGDLEAAKAEFDKASALAENDPGALLGLARIEAVRADRVWLQQYLLPEDATSAKEIAASEMRGRITKLGAALSAAKRVAPDDPRTVQLEIDFQRIQGNVTAARAIIAQLTTDATDPDTAYVLAALDVAEASPVWSTVLQRLGAAMARDRGLGRAQALLIVAYAKSGDIKIAERELEKLRVLPSLHAITELLSAFVKRTAADVDVAPDTSAEPATAPDLPKDESAGPTSARAALNAAAAARRDGKLDKAEELFQQALQLQPGSFEANAGLGDLAKRQGQLAKARGYFETALASNPDYVPAIIGLADLKWAAGEHGTAATLYEKVIPGTPDYDRAQRRIQQLKAKPGLPVVDDSPPWPEDAPAPREPAPEAVAPEAEDLPASPKIKSEDPYIDTSDLPD